GHAPRDRTGVGRSPLMRSTGLSSSRQLEPAGEVFRDGDLGKLIPGTGDLRWPPTAPLRHDDLAADEQLAAPDAPLLTTIDGALEARRDHRAGGAEGLGPGDVLELVREEHPGELARSVRAG